MRGGEKLPRSPQVGIVRRKIPTRSGGYGFIRHEHTRDDYFFHADELINVTFEDLQVGDRVVFLIRKDNRGQVRAVDVARLDKSAER